MSSKVLWVVEAKIDPEVEQDWNNWYDDIHLPDIMTCPGFLSATRLVHEKNGERVYLAIYELDSSAAVESKAFGEKRGWGPFLSHVKASARLFISS